MRLIFFAIYIAIGAMLHALVVGATFDWSSAWTFSWLFGWPLMLIITFRAVIIIGMIAGAIIWMALEWLKTIAQWKERRKARH